MTHISPPGKKNNRSSLLSLENNYRRANGGAKLLTIRKLKSVYYNIIGPLFFQSTVPMLVLCERITEPIIIFYRFDEISTEIWVISKTDFNN